MIGNIRGSVRLSAFLAALASFGDRYRTRIDALASVAPRRAKSVGVTIRTVHQGSTFIQGRNAAKRAARAKRERYIAENRNVPRSSWKRVWRIREETSRMLMKGTRP